MMTVFYSKEAQFELSDEEFKAFIAKANTGEKVWIPRLKVFLSNMFIWAGARPADRERGRLHDGTRVIKKFGEWVNALNPEAKINPAYYPEIARDEVMSEEEYLSKIEIKKMPGGKIGELN